MAADINTLNAIAWGEYDRAFEILGAHPDAKDESVWTFTLWAPQAIAISVIGDFNQWDPHASPMQSMGSNGLWQASVKGVQLKQSYQFQIKSAVGAASPGADSEVAVRKSDPYARAAQLRPWQSSVIAPLPTSKSLSDERKKANRLDAPISIYEVHLGSWRRKSVSASAAGEGLAFLNWQELSEQLPQYAADLGFTHLELLPITEHPFDGSWGYQTLGLYAPSARFGDPSGLAHFIDACHAQGVGVIVDWVPAHFPTDEFGLANFDGAALFEYADPKEGFHRDWKTLIYDFENAGVRNFLTGSALYWLERYGADGLRVDAVASMLYRDYSRDSGQWIPNQLGGRENLEAISLFKRINTLIQNTCEGAMCIAEESTAFPGVTTAAKDGGLGFQFKWNMGWMHDSLQYVQTPIHFRHSVYGQLIRTLTYAFSEQFVLPLSHDEVVHGKRSIFGRMPGNESEQFANLRAYYAMMWAYPGKKLLFMGQEFGQASEWNHDQSLPWAQAQLPESARVADTIRQLNTLYRQHAALHQLDGQSAGFEWLVNDDAQGNVLAWLRKDRKGNQILVVCNFGGKNYNAYRMGCPAGQWRCILNTADTHLLANVQTENKPMQGFETSITLELAALSTAYYQLQHATE